MKKKSVHLIFITVGFLVYFVGSLLNITATTSITAILPILVIGFCFASSKTLNKVGYAINAIMAINAIYILSTADLPIDAIGLLIMFIGSLTYFVGAMLRFFGFVK